jgi:excisionase family DNA binding protein
MPDKLAQKLDRAAEHFGVSKRDLLATLVSDHLDIEGDELVFRPHGRGASGRGRGEAAEGATTEAPEGGEATASGAAKSEAADGAAEEPSRPNFQKHGRRPSDGPRPPWPADLIWRTVAGTDPFGRPASAPAAPPSEVLSLDEAAALLRVSADDVRALAEAGEIPARRIGAEWRLNRTAVLAWLGEGGAAAAS